MTDKDSSNYVCIFSSAVMVGTLPPHYKKISVYASGKQSLLTPRTILKI
jgi:hypothetical protein